MSAGDRPSFRPAHPEEFLVDEIPAFEPVGTGDHCFVRIEKRLLSTPEAITRLAEALGCDPRAAGFAGMKDRVAVTTQWISLEGAEPERVLAIGGVEGIRVLEAKRHPRRLRTGQLRGNRFTIRLRDGAGVDRALAQLAEEGLDNRFGPQRFAGDNVARGRALVLGEVTAIRDRIERRLLVSAIQAAVFNDYVDLRPRELDGEPLRRGVPTGPVPGYRMPRPREGSPARELEDEVLGRAGLTLEDFRRVRRLGRGSRRVLRIRLGEASCTPVGEGDAVFLRFTLPAGCYATEVMAELLSRAWRSD